MGNCVGESRVVSSLEDVTSAFAEAKKLANFNPIACLSICSRLLGLVPDNDLHWRVYELVAKAYLHAGRQDLAESAIVRALAIAPLPTRAVLWNEMGDLLQGRSRMAEARRAYELCVAHTPTSAEGWYNFGNACSRLGRHSQALDAFRRALTLQPTLNKAVPMLLNESLALADWRNWPMLTARCLDLLRGGTCLPPFTSALLPDATSADHAAASLRWARHHYSGMSSARAPVHTDPLLGERLHVAYLSADFHDQAAAHLLVGVLDHHDQEAFRVSLYSYGPDDQSPMWQRLSQFEGFKDVHALSDEAIAQQIAQDGVHVLVDLKGYAAGGRPGILAWLAAPVQVQFGWPGVSGLPWVDWLLADTVVCPPDELLKGIEPVWHLPGSYLPTDNQRDVGPIPSKAQAGLPARGIVLAALHPTHKLNPEVFDTWCKILCAVPGSVLWLLEPNAPEAREQLRLEAVSRGVARERVIFAPRLVQEYHLARLALADIWLDTWPYGSHMAASDALWVGVPVLSFPGATFASRVCASVLHAAGLSEHLCRDADHYAHTGIEWLTQPEKLAQVRLQVSQARESEFFDSDGFVRKLESTWLKMWRQGTTRLAEKH